MNEEFNNTGVVGEVVTESVISNKSWGVAALLAFFLGMLGIHRFYLGKVGSGVVMLLLSFIGGITLSFFVGAILLLIVAFWSVIDFFLILFNVLKDSEGRKLR